jgi:hypothetical protein
MTFYTNENLKANSPRSNGDTLQIHQQLSPEEYQMRRYLNERADYERYASLNTPTYGMWNGESFESTDPNRIAEINANAEMRRTGLDRYYHPNSAAYYAAFQGIRDKYLQQEMAKKAAIENEGKQLYSNRMGAFDKLIQDQYGLQKEKVESAGLAKLRAAQTAEALAKAKSYDSDGMTPKERLASKKDEKAKLAAMADDSRVQLLAKINDPATSTQDRATYIDAMNKINTNLDADFALIDKGEAPQHMKEFFKWQAFPSQYKPMSNTQPVKATNEITVVGPDGRTYIQRPKSTKSQQGMVFKVGKTGLGATPEKPKPQSLEDRLFYGCKRNN